MAIKTSPNDITVHVPEGKSLRVEFEGAGGQLYIGEQVYSVNESGLVLPANDQQGGSFAQRVLEVGQRLRDGTVVLSVDLDKDEALFVPAEIFGGRATFDKQNDVVAYVNKEALHGHKDWRRITDDEGDTLAHNWAKVTTKEPEWFWLASSSDGNFGRVRHGGYSGWDFNGRANSYPVPVVRRGLARNLDI
ncbi:MAG TPA: hypothetical protein DCM27_03115 [Rhodospirillaceae bacterium]|nr:hypothetical protein [Rhodospirillaceae bacterium]